MPHPDMNAKGGHPDEGLLHEWLDDQLSPSDAADMQTHIAFCAECGMRVAEARGLIAASHRILAALDEVPSGVIPLDVAAIGVVRSEGASAAAYDRAAAPGVVSIDDARTATGNRSRKRAFRWQRVAPIAAVLLVAVTLARSEFVDAAKRESANDMVPALRSEPLAAPAAATNLADSVVDSRAPVATAEPARDALGKRPAIAVAERIPNRDKTVLTEPNAAALASARKAREQGAALPRLQSRATANSAASKSTAGAATTVNAAGGAATVAQSPATGATGSIAAATVAPPPTTMITAATPPVVADQTATRADSGVVRGFAGGGRGGRGGAAGGGGGRGGAARGGTAEPPATTAAASARGAGGAAAAGTMDASRVAGAVIASTVGNTPPVGSAAALPALTPPAAAPTTTLRDSSALRAELEAALRPRLQGQAQTRGTDTTGNAPRLLLRSPSGGVSADAKAAPRNGAAAFDSVTLIRTTCAPSCEPSALHVNASGEVRYTVGSGNTQRVVMSQLTTAERAELQVLLLRSFSSAILQRGRTVCVSQRLVRSGRNGRENAPEVQLLVDFPGRSTLGPEQRCAKSETELREISERVEAIAGGATLNGKVPPRE